MRNLLHYLFSTLMWLLFGYYWYVVVERQIGQDSLEPLGILFGLTILGLGITLWWIAHNKRIAAKGKRRHFMKAPKEPFEFDNLGRPIVAPPVDELKNAGVVNIQVNDQGHKIYTTGAGGMV